MPYYPIPRPHLGFVPICDPQLVILEARQNIYVVYSFIATSIAVLARDLGLDNLLEDIKSDERQSVNGYKYEPVVYNEGKSIWPVCRLA